MKIRTIGLYQLLILASITALAACDTAQPPVERPDNPFLTDTNVPLDYASVTAENVTAYGEYIMEWASRELDAIKSVSDPSFDSVIEPFDYILAELWKANSNCHLMFWVSTEEAIRQTGLDARNAIDKYRVEMYSDRELFDLVLSVSDAGGLDAVQQKLVDDLILAMQYTGVDLAPDDLERFKVLTDELNELEAAYTNNMNSDSSTLVLDEDGAAGLPETLTSRYATDEGTYEIPVIAVNSSPVMNNASLEETRREFYMLYRNRAVDTNLEVLDQLVAKRHELARIMGHPSYADYALSVKMAETPANVWAFLNDLTTSTADKAEQELARLIAYRSASGGAPPTEPLSNWDYSYYRNQILINEYGVDASKVREYLPLARALTGMMDLYQELLGVEFRKVDNPSVWHEEVEMYEVYESGQLVGRFYLDLFPRPGKESWFYGMTLTPGNATADGYELPVGMLLSNFTRPSDTLPSLISHGELNTLFHEFGHIMAAVSFKGPYASQNGSMPDFGEAMSQIFENWIWDYDVLKTFAMHYDTGEVLPEETFNNMLAAKNLTSGIGTQNAVRSSMYDMTLYNLFDPDNPVSTDQVWRNLSDRFVYADYVEGTHTQAAWIHINGYPTYYYGYLWSEVYAADMFTQFEENGLRDTETGVRYRELILANGTQRPIDDVVEEFIGRPMNNEAYIRGLGLE